MWVVNPIRVGRKELGPEQNEVSKKYGKNEVSELATLAADGTFWFKTEFRGDFLKKTCQILLRKGPGGDQPTRRRCQEI